MRIKMVLPLVCGILPGMLFSVLTGRARLFTTGETGEFLRNIAGVYGIFILLSLVIYFMFRVRAISEW